MKRMNRFARLALLSLLLVVTWSLCLCLIPSADGNHPDRLVDNADLLTPAEENEIRARLDSLSEKYQIDIVIVTTNTLDGKWIRDYADDFYDYNGYGLDSRNSGILLVRYISAYDREVYITTTGGCIETFSDYSIERILDSMEYNCYADNMPGAFNDFMDSVEGYLSYVPHEKTYNPLWFIVSLVVGLIVALIVTSSMKNKLNSVRAQKFAGNYIRNNSLNMYVNRDIYLYRTVSRVRREHNSSSGGSSTHRSSSGTSHGGGGRHM